MRKLLSLITLLAVSSAAHALDVCEMKRTQYERAQCYEFVVKGGLMRMEKNYQTILNSERVPQANKGGIAENHEKWAKQVDQQCSDRPCQYQYISQRNIEVEQFMRKYGLRPY